MKETAIRAAKEAGKILMDNFGKIKKIDSKGFNDFVTNVDIESENRIIEIIKSKFPNHNILTEESKVKETNSEYRWVIDPLDGTHTYIYGLPFFSVSIALEHKKEILFGVIYAPYFGMLLTAEKGKGAFLNSKKIKVSDRDLDKAMIAYESGSRVDRKYWLAILNEILDHVARLRIFGAATVTLTYIALGNLDLFITFNAKPWDIAAGALIVEEAGGRVTSLEGEPWTLLDKRYIISNGKIHNQILELIKNVQVH